MDIYVYGRPSRTLCLWTVLVGHLVLGQLLIVQKTEFFFAYLVEGITLKKSRKNPNQGI